MKQTCLTPVYGTETDKQGKKRMSRTHYKLTLPNIISDDLTYEMQFGWPSPKIGPKKTESGIKVQCLDTDY
tara:strand:- start:570 stop:782 length:213 start_codon:yes stop_codon:yes gene_type:complete